jgi:hypothetical protein
MFISPGFVDISDNWYETCEKYLHGAMNPSLGTASWLVIRGLFSTCEQANVSTNNRTLDLILSQKGDSLNHWPILYRSNIFISPHINSVYALTSD